MNPDYSNLIIESNFKELNLTSHAELKKFAVHTLRLKAGEQSSQPHCESHEEEFLYVLSGQADLWLDGWLFRVGEGFSCAWPAGSGHCHTLINNSSEDVVILNIGERTKPENRCYFPLNPERKIKDPDLYWADAPQLALGPHDGISDLIRGTPTPSTHYRKTIPSYLGHRADFEDSDTCHYPGSSELLCYGSALGRKLGLTKLGVHHENLLPGRRSSWPHAESNEEEFVFVLEGSPHVWLHGYLHPLKAGDAVAFPAQSGIAHCLINNQQTPCRLLVVGEASGPDCQIYYPLHPERRAHLKHGWWELAPKLALGPHDGLPDLMRK